MQILSTLHSRNWLGGQAQQGVADSLYSSWRSVTRGVLLRSVLGPVLFNIFISNLEEVREGEQSHRICR